ncbi:MAG: hypothetical protein QW507_00240 [Candidatus Nanoarchaeia archaeon]|nr:hypothetical protein [Candidatus Haiyanarchaeum thermophilum]MCW1302990.1 hypothetical protein [Candidatus Haiyanarchaeum thermophilum]MCW1303668.1 hypothetical protein [Candidatus Haiyanarchaeum thermophilum]MCW1306348.1 hypothetical protein [Candidatus Haiyanarchaeum thermophilum]MCW1307142.1 hypothetical protein [Candidatus Haiyanarchaeum thermophilum]
MRYFQLVVIPILLTPFFSFAYSQSDQFNPLPTVEIKAICGDRICAEGENCDNCPQDCKCPINETCINGTCVPRGRCGNYICESSENCDNCPQDCKCPIGFSCSERVCVSKIQATGFAVLLVQVREKAPTLLLSVIVLLLAILIKKKMSELGIG